MKLRFFVICYGNAHADLYERIAVRSLTQTRNRAAIPSGAVVALYSDAATMPRVSQVSERLGTVEPHVMALSENHYDTQNRAFIEEVGNCVREDATLVIVNPDCFWGDGSLANLLAIAGEQNVCIASPHVRVDADAFCKEGLLSVAPERVIDNPSLVSLAMKTLHQSWIDADVSKPRANSFATGIGIRSANGLHVVHHLQPTVFLARLNARDYGFFAERPQARGLWDHVWPEILVAENRQRIVASSDAVFIAELTNSDTHNTELYPVDPKKPDAFFRDAPHISANRGVVSIWRENST